MNRESTVSVVADEALAKYLNQIGVAPLEKIETAKAFQSEKAKSGVELSLGEALVQQGVITADTLTSVERLLKAEQDGGLQQLGHYKLIKKLGEGGMGAVYLAEDTAMLRKVALKILPRKHSGDSAYLARFKREAQATAKLSHVNIVAAYYAGEDLGHHYYTMEYCEGGSLFALLQMQKIVDCAVALNIVIQVARGLKHAHDNGFIHRDIKPDNIFLTTNGVAKILDLGLSKDITDAEQSFNTETGVFMGTPHYMSPEQTRGSKDIDGRADIYSLGGTFYHLITGTTPFQGSVASLLHKNVNEQSPNPQDIVPSIPTGVAQVIMKMLKKDPADRYRNCDELLADLERVSAGAQPLAGVADSAGTYVYSPATIQSGGKRPPLENPPTLPPDSRMPSRAPASIKTRETVTAAAPTPAPTPANETKRSFGLAFVLVGMCAAIVVAILAIQSRQRADDDARIADEKQLTEARLKGEVARLEKEKRDLAEAKQKTIDAEKAALELQKQMDSPPATLTLDLGNGATMEMLLVKPGEFIMGDANGTAEIRPAHKVKFSRPYYIGKFTVTVGQYKAFADAAKYQTLAEKMGRAFTMKDNDFVQVSGANWRNPMFPQTDNHPVVAVSWDDTQAFCKWASEKTGRKIRLPTEAEWEYAARGPESLQFPWGNSWIGVTANVADAALENGVSMKIGAIKENDGYACTSPVGTYKNGVSWCGAYDMAGNVWQWCNDFFDANYYRESPAVDPPGPATGTNHVMKGGSWHNSNGFCRSSYRGRNQRIETSCANGFRVVVTTGP